MNPEQSTIHIFSANLGRWLGPALPKTVVGSAREYLRTERRPAACAAPGSWSSATTCTCT